MERIARSEEETKKIGKDIASELKGGDIVALHGDLGAGKTTLVKGIAEGLGIKEEITSPTFTLMNVYKIKNNELKIKELAHIDTYRLKNEQELIDIGVEDYLGAPDTICIVEWPEKIANLLRDKVVKYILIEHASETKRKIVIE